VLDQAITGGLFYNKYRFADGNNGIVCFNGDITCSYKVKLQASGKKGSLIPNFHKLLKPLVCWI
jgi:hypothetical protein